jgi:hypothetical protein
MPLPSFFDCGHDFSQDQDAIGEVVLVDLSDGLLQDWCLYCGNAERTGGPSPDYSAAKQPRVCSSGQPSGMVKEIDRYRG